MMAITFLPLCMMLFISFLTVDYIYPMICYYVKENSQDKLEFSDTEIEKIMRAKANHKIKKLKLISLFLTSMIINIVLLMLHIISANEFIAYGDEVLTDDSIERHLPYIHAKLSYAAVGIMFITAVVASISNWRKCSLIATSISVNFIYFTCYFFPVMLLAFIHDPLLTTFTCVMVGVFVVFIYAYLFGAGLCLFSNIINKHTPSNFQSCIYPITAGSAALSILLFFIMIVSMIHLGSFGDFQALQNMQMSLLVVLLTIFVPFKQGKKYICKYVKLSKMKEKEGITSTNNADEACTMIKQMEDNNNTDIGEMMSQNDENTII